MASLNNVVLSGNLGADPEVRYSQSGTPIANISLAISEYRKDQNGEGQQITHWIKAVAFGRTAEIVGQYCHKGSKIGISGRLSTRQWEDQNGQTRYVTEVIIRDLDLPPKSDGGARQQTTQSRQNTQQSGGGSRNTAQYGQEPLTEPPDEDIPF